MLVAGFRPHEIRQMDVWHAQRLAKRAILLHHPFAGGGESSEADGGKPKVTQQHLGGSRWAQTTTTTYKAVT